MEYLFRGLHQWNILQGLRTAVRGKNGGTGGRYYETSVSGPIEDRRAVAAIGVGNRRVRSVKGGMLLRDGAVDGWRSTGKTR